MSLRGRNKYVNRCLITVAVLTLVLTLVVEFQVAIATGGKTEQTSANVAIPKTSTLTKRHGRVNVVIYLRDQTALANWQSDRGDARRAAGIGTAGSEQVRQRAIAKLNRDATKAAGATQQIVSTLVQSLGGVVTGTLPAPSTIYATLPAKRLGALARSPRVLSVREVGERTYATTASVHGGTTWHAAGCAATGAADTCPATSAPQATTGPVNSTDGNGGPDILVDDQGINCHHDAFTGGPTPAIGRTPAIVRPSDAPACGTGDGANGSLHANTIAAVIAVKDPAHLGVAYGVDKILDSNYGCTFTPAWGIGLPVYFSGTPYCPAGWRPGATDIPEAWNKSWFYSSENALDDGGYSEQADMEASQYGIGQAIGAGNGGSYGPFDTTLRTCYDNPDNPTCQYRVQHPCVAYNSICMGAVHNPTDSIRAHDIVEDYSSRGPSVGGRKKPDLVAFSGAATGGCPNGGYSGAPDSVKDTQWPGFGSCGEGTSYATPFAAAGQLLLSGIGVTSPMTQRAVLINSALPIDSEDDGDTTAQEYWTPDVGWGEIDFAQAYADRGNWRTGQIDGAPANNARFFRVNGQSAGDRTTLAWNRRAVTVPDPIYLDGRWTGETLGYTVSDLNVYQLTLAGADDDRDVCGASTTCGVDASESADNIPARVTDTGIVKKWETTGDNSDTTEQVRAQSAGDSIIKVKAASPVVGQSREDFALASTEPLIPLSTPTIAAPAPTLSDSSVAENENVTVTAFATNESSGTDLVAGLDLQSVSVSINLPAGVTCVPSPCVPADLGTLATSATESASWTVRATTSAAHQITFTATGSRFGETFATTSSPVTLTADSLAPSIDLSAPAGWQTSETNSVGWSTIDALSGVASVTVEASINGSAWRTLYSGGDGSGSLQVSGPEGAHVSVRAQATDQQANVSAYDTVEWSIDAELPEIALNAPASVTYGDGATVFVTAGNTGSAISTTYRIGNGSWQPVTGGVVQLPSVRATTTVEVRVTDELGRETTSSVQVSPRARMTSLSIRGAKRGAKSRIHVATTPSASGTFSIDARCVRAGKARARVTKVFRSGGASTVTLGKRLGRCRVSVSFTPSDRLASQSARASRILRL